MKVRDILKRKGGTVISTSAGCTLKEAIGTLVTHGVGSLLVTEDGDRIVGIISERDILRASAHHFDRLRELTVGDIMSRDVLIGLADDDVTYVEGIMTDHRIRHLPIMDSGKLVGIVSIGDVVKARKRGAEQEVRHLTDFIQGHYPA